MNNAPSNGKTEYSGGMNPEDFTGGSVIGFRHRKALLHFYSQNPDSVFAYAHQVFSEFPDSARSLSLLRLLHRTAVNYDRMQEFEAALTLLKTNAPSSVLKSEAQLMLIDLTAEDKMAAMEELARTHSGSDYLEVILFRQFLYALFEMNDRDKAEQTLLELSVHFPNSQTVVDASMLLNSGRGLNKPTGESESDILPEEYELLGNYPNPFNPSTTFRFALPFESDVKITIYDIMGARITSLTLDGKPAGYHNVLWNGRNSNGAQVSSGIYLYRFEAQSLENNLKYIENAKMMMLK